MRRTFGTLLVVLLVVLAGCTGGPAGGPNADPTATSAPTDAGSTTDSPTGGTATTAPTNDAGVVNFYVSDEPNAIGDFAHLNVTISKIGFARAGGGGTDTDAESDSTETNGSDDAGAGGWVEHDVDNRTVDLTRLRGPNASFVGSYDLPAGTYTKTFAYVSTVEATLTTGETVTVKLPSEKLQLNSKFDVGPNASVDFVFDIGVHEAGNSGRYVLQPTISESGANQPIEAVDGPKDERKHDRKQDEDHDRDRNETADGPSLNATFVGNATPGENATIQVTRAGSAVANATVSIDGQVVGTTDADGTATVALPDAETVVVVVTSGEAEAELAVEAGS